MAVIVLDLPLPPSVNRLWKPGRGRLYCSPEYEGWIKTAGAEILAQKPKLSPKGILGPYRLILIASRATKMDLGNIEKAVSDLLQKHQIIQNDNFCQAIFIRWDDTGKLPMGCRAKIKSIPMA